MGKNVATPESHKSPMLLALIDPSVFFESIVAALRTKEPSELTWNYVASTVIDEYNVRESKVRYQLTCTQNLELATNAKINVLKSIVTPLEIMMWDLEPTLIWIA